MLVAWGPLGLLLLAVIDSAGVPIPAGVDALLITVSVREPSRAYLSALCAVAGSVAGNCILFWIARKGGEAFLAKHITRGAGRRLHTWFHKYGLVTVFIPAVSFIPLPTKVPVFCSGALGVRWSYFVAVITAARAIRYFVLAYVGKRYGTSTLVFLKQHAFGAGVITLTLALGVLIFARLTQRRTNKASRISSQHV